jgi:FMN-dependent NADH-azoreductase
MWAKPLACRVGSLHSRDFLQEVDSMSKVLYIKANAKPEGSSRTFRMSEAFIEEYRKADPRAEIVTLDLYQEKIGFLTEEGISLHRPKPGEGQDHPILKYAYQFAGADKYVISAPFWNLGIPAILKAYIDYICVTGITFQYTATGPVGMGEGKKAINFISRGGDYSSAFMAGMEMGDKYLRNIFGFLGVRDFTTVAADKLDMIGEDHEGLLKAAVAEARKQALAF